MVFVVFSLGEEGLTALVAGIFDFLITPEPLLPGVLSMPLAAFFCSVPILCGLHRLVHVSTERLWVFCDPLICVVPGVLASCDKFKVSDFVVPAISVLVVDVIPFRDWSVVVFPDNAVETFVVPAEIALSGIEVVFFPVENLDRYSPSVSHSSRNCFHPFAVLIL